jgi:hypothetical protein
MYWSGYDTSILITGILTLVLSVVPGLGVTNQTRAVVGVVGAALVIISIITGNTQAFIYPSIVTIAPGIPVVAGIIMVIRARNLAAADRQSVEVSARVVPSGEMRPPSPARVAPASVVATSASVVPTLELLARAVNPETPLGTLAELAYDHPELRAAIAANPSTYPGLIEWLRELNDPAIAHALASRLPTD